MITLPSTYSVTCTDALLRDIIPQFQIDKAVQCIFWCQGLNDSYKVITKNETFLLRIYRYQWRTLEEINFELDVLLYLHNNGLDVAYPIATKQGGYTLQIKTPEGIRHVILTRYITGNELNFSCSDSASLYGEKVAQLHKCSEGFSSSHTRAKLDAQQLIIKPVQLINPFLGHRKNDCLFIENYAKQLTEHLQRMLIESQDIGFCHGDLHGGNAHSYENNLAFFDFDCCGIGLRLYDLAVFKWALNTAGKKDIIWQNFIRSYQRYHPLSNNSIKDINILVSIRQIWLMGVHIEVAVAKGWLSDAYFDQKIEFLRDQEKLLSNGIATIKADHQYD